MAITTYLAQSCVAVGTTFVGVVSFEINDSAATVVDTRSNAELRLKKACLIGLSESITLTVKDPGVRPVIGAGGSFSAVGVRHTGGVTLAGTLTIAAATCVVKNLRTTIGDDGQPRLVIELEVTSADGIASGLTYTIV